MPKVYFYKAHKSDKSDLCPVKILTGENSSDLRILYAITLNRDVHLGILRKFSAGRRRGDAKVKDSHRAERIGRKVAAPLRHQSSAIVIEQTSEHMNDSTMRRE